MQKFSCDASLYGLNEYGAPITRLPGAPDRMVYLASDVESIEAGIGWAVRQLLQDLPKSRDWLNPNIERVMREFDSDRRARGL